MAKTNNFKDNPITKNYQTDMQMQKIPGGLAIKVVSFLNLCFIILIQTPICKTFFTKVINQIMKVMNHRNQCSIQWGKKQTKKKKESTLKFNFQLVYEICLSPFSCESRTNFIATITYHFVKN